MPASTIFRDFAAGQSLGAQRNLANQQSQSLRDEEARRTQNRSLQQAAAQGGVGSQEFLNFAGADVQGASKLQGLLGQIGEERETALFKDSRKLNGLLKRGNIEGGLRMLDDRLDNLDRLSAETGKAADPSDTLEIREMITSGNVDEAIELLNGVEQVGIQQGLIKGEKSGEAGLSSEQRSFERNLRIAGIKPGTEKFKKAVEVKLRLQAGAVGSSAQTIASTGIAQQVGESQGVIKGAEESGKLKAKLKFEPQLIADIELARASAAEKGEVLTDLARLEAGLPGLTDAVSQLRALSQVATSTFAGRAFDTLVKESGFGATRGKTARTKFIAIISNQILPLLKPTFGGSFTVEEGDKLEATLGDPNNSVDEKMAALDAFVDQNERNIRGKQLQLTPQGQGALSAAEQAELDALEAEFGGQ